MKRRQLLSPIVLLVACGASLPFLGGTAHGQSGRVTHPLRAPLSAGDPLARVPAHLLHAPALSKPKARASARLTGPAVQAISHSLVTGRTIAESTIGRLANPGRLGEPQVGSAARAPTRADTRYRAEAVFGTDTRERIDDTTEFPFSAVCKLYMTYPSGETFVASGSLIAAGYVLTAGHVVYNHDEGGWAEEILVVAGQDGDLAPFGTASGINVKTFRGWTDVGSTDFDMGLITLDDRVGDSAGWLGYSVYGSLSGVIGNLSGYPTDLEEGDAQYYDYGRITATSRYLVYHKIDTAPGTSGAPIYRIQNRRRYVFAVNSFQTATSNGGVRIDRPKFDSIVRWIRSGQ